MTHARRVERKNQDEADLTPQKEGASYLHPTTIMGFFNDSCTLEGLTNHSQKEDESSLEFHESVVSKE